MDNPCRVLRNRRQTIESPQREKQPTTSCPIPRPRGGKPTAQREPAATQDGNRPRRRDTTPPATEGPVTRSVTSARQRPPPREQAEEAGPSRAAPNSVTPHRDEEEENSIDHHADPPGQQFRVTRHANTQRKIRDWKLEVRKKHLVIGDSNLSSIPPHGNSDLQIDCYPGGHFRHGQALMEKAWMTENVVVEKVILSFGINSRSNKCKETTIKNLQAAIRTAKKKFPYAEVWVPLINFSENLPEEEKENLTALNNHIERNMQHLPPLPPSRFRVRADDIHWTTGTGSTL
ncbi:uncharacterized protein LOC133496045 [Syngnathoides biaculeatus]|uniref:uncharacterized protein LOC133496045 n=1 Tax=Syngnathoides biaculeatus TaxID=300417 RepID=UPI002ADDEEA9|nr:uncharacterized protein LOC133496045 [Syngnathoides biaculeatus]